VNIQRHRKALLAAAVLWAATVQAGPTDSTFQQEVKAGTEEIYIFRTTRTAQTRGATPACTAAPFTSTNEQDFDLWSLDVRGSDSRVVNTHKSGVGSFAACFSAPAQDHALQMYAAGSVAHIPWVGIGECIVPKAQPPVHTVVTYTCRLDLSGLPEKYDGGFAISSTLATFLRDQPPTAHVPGYVSTSIVTVRLWRKVPAAERP